MKANSITILSENKARKKHPVSYDTILGMENAFCECGCKIHCTLPAVYRWNQIANKIKWIPTLPDFTIPIGGGN